MVKRGEKYLKMETLFQNYKLEIPKIKTSERAELISFFVENLFDKNKKPFSKKRIAVALSYLELKDLYYFKSVCQDILNRKGSESMNKFFWWSIKAK